MNLLAVKILQFNGENELAGKQLQAHEPTFYDDGTVELQADLAGKEAVVYVRFSIAELVRMRAEAAKVEEAPE